jgi:ABC-type nitrate/sulfonate/bicarbonate transport system ATPase subunit
VAFIEVRDLAKSFNGPKGPKPVLGGVHLDVEHGEFVSIVGPMGSGKSTLMALLSGLSTPDAGTVTIDGEPVTGVRRDAAVVFQNYSLLPWFSALENVRLAVAAAFPDRPPGAHHAKAADALTRVGLGNALAKRPSQLSGGMRQRVAIARAMATDPTVLFLDEPFGALDALTREALQQDLARLSASQTRPVTTVMITNSVEEALLLSDRIVPMVAGPPARLGTPIPVALSRPRSLEQLAHEEQAMQVRAHVIATLTAAPGRRLAAREAKALSDAASSVAQAAPSAP